MSSLITKLEQMTPEELAKVEALINNIGERKSGVTHHKRKRRGSGGKRRKEEVVDEQPEDEDDRPQRRRGGRRQGGFDIDEHRQSRRQGHTKRAGDKLARVEPMNITGRRPNKFLKSEFVNLYKSDTKIDKLLRGKNKPTKRGPTRLITVKCSSCGTKCKVAPQVINDDGRFRCDDCVAEL